MEIISPTSYNWLGDRKSGGGGGGGGGRWTAAENKLFENALAVYDRDTPDRWHNVAAIIPGKTVGDVITKYRELEYDVSNIEAGLVPIPGYTTSTFTLDWVNNTGHGCVFGLGGKRPSSARPVDQERKKGVPWTEEEHKLFLMGLKKYGKGDWRNISRNFVVTRTPTQVASHAQKYFIRQLSGGKDKRRASIHDITTVNLNEVRTPSPETKRASSPENSSSVVPSHHPVFQWNQPSSGGGFHMTNGNMFVSNPYGINSSYGIKLQGPHSSSNLSSNNPHRSAVHESSYLGPQSMVFQMQTQRYSMG